MAEKMTNRQRAALETKRRLLDAAKAIVCEKGLANTSVEEITKACVFQAQRGRTFCAER